MFLKQFCFTLHNDLKEIKHKFFNFMEFNFCIYKLIKHSKTDKFQEDLN